MAEEESEKLSQEDIDKCIAILKQLNADSTPLAELSQEKRKDLLFNAGKLSRPIRHERQKRRNDSRRVAKRKQFERDKHARKETGIGSARDASIFVAPKLLNAASLEEKEEHILTSPQSCYL